MISRQTAQRAEDYNEHGVWCREKEVVSNDESFCYVLNVSNASELKNKWRYIKEVLLQHHNYNMQCDYQKLIQNDINVLRMKSDAFVVECPGFKKWSLTKHKSDAGMIGFLGEWPRVMNCFSTPYAVA